MKNEDIYRAWKQSRRRINVRPGFSQEVVDRILRSESRNTMWSACRALTDRISTSLWAQAAAVGIAALLGIGRILLTLHVLLSA